MRKVFSVLEITLDCEIKTDDPQSCVIAGKSIPRAVFQQMSDCKGYWHVVLAEGWTVANLSDLLSDGSSAKHVIIRNHGVLEGDIVLPIAIVAKITKHERVVFED